MHLATHLPHLPEVVAQQESVPVFTHAEIEFNLVEVDKLRLDLSKLRINGVQRCQEDRDARVAPQQLEQVVAPQLDFLGVAQVCNLLLLSSLVLATDFSVVHARTDISSACDHAVIVDCLPVSG